MKKFLIFLIGCVFGVILERDLASDTPTTVKIELYGKTPNQVHAELDSLLETHYR